MNYLTSYHLNYLGSNKNTGIIGRVLRNIKLIYKRLRLGHAATSTTVLESYCIITLKNAINNMRRLN